MCASDGASDLAQRVVVVALPVELLVRGDGDNVDLALPGTREARAWSRSCLPCAKLTKLAVHRFRDAAECFRLDGMRERQAEHSHAEVRRRCVHPPDPGDAELIALHRFKRGKLLAAVSLPHSGAIPR